MCIYRRFQWECNHAADTVPVRFCRYAYSTCKHPVPCKSRNTSSELLSPQLCGDGKIPCNLAEHHPVQTIRISSLCRACNHEVQRLRGVTKALADGLDTVRREVERLQGVAAMVDAPQKESEVEGEVVEEVMTPLELKALEDFEPVDLDALQIAAAKAAVPANVIMLRAEALEKKKWFLSLKKSLKKA